MFKTRLISGIFLVIAALLTIISGGYVLFVTLLCVSLLGIQELYKAMEVHKDGIGLLEMAGRIIGGVVLAPFFGYLGVFAGLPIGWGLGMIYGVSRYMSGSWMKKRLVK